MHKAAGLGRVSQFQRTFVEGGRKDRFNPKYRKAWKATCISKLKKLKGVETESRKRIQKWAKNRKRREERLGPGGAMAILDGKSGRRERERALED